MFAVPGWSVSTSELKRQTSEASNATPKATPTANNGTEGASEDRVHNKRKRSGKSKPQAVNASNLADVWATVIEGQPMPKKERSEKRQKISGPDEQSAKEDHDEETQPASASRDKKNDKEERQKKGKSLKEKKREKKAALKKTKDGSADIIIPAAEDSIPKPHPPKQALQLTPLQSAMRQKLISARFRHLNQTLYTTPSAHSLSLFQENPEMFNEYHEGFRRQVEIWPENPVDGYILDIKSRGKPRAGQRGKPGKKENASAVNSEIIAVPLPRTEGTCTLADLGCGDATLSTALQPLTKTLNLKIHSFDLQAPSRLITKADIAKLPLADGSVDIAIFCLALMGTNWIDFIEEAFRILRWKGELWISEIKSRFGRVGGGKNKVVSHSVGNRKRAEGGSKKEAKNKEEQEDDEVATVEVDGVEDRAQETDVSAFIEVLRKRGFVLRGEGRPGDEVKKAVDLENRMFVKMWFVKGTTPVKGKCVPVPKGMEKMGLETWKKKPQGKYVDAVEEDEKHVSSEAAVLKPCVYKLR